MNAIRNLLAVIGAVMLVLWIAGSVGVGNFYFYYGPTKVECTKEPK